MFGSFWRKFFITSRSKPEDSFGRLSYFDEELNPILARRVAELELDLLDAQKEIQSLKASRDNLQEFLERFRERTPLPEILETPQTTPLPSLAEESEAPL